jgi:hypothetical protein
MEAKTAKITLGGEEVTISKLKAGKFYEAQSVFSEIIESAAGAADTQEVGPEQLRALMNIMPRKMAEFVAVCAQMDAGELLEKAEPEEIPPAFETCYKLNNVMENLKNFQSPMQAIGGVEEEVQPAPEETPKEEKKEK